MPSACATRAAGRRRHLQARRRDFDHAQTLAAEEARRRRHLRGARREAARELPRGEELLVARGVRIVDCGDELLERRAVAPGEAEHEAHGRVVGRATEPHRAALERHQMPLDVRARAGRLQTRIRND